MKTGQSRKASFAESLLNVAIGYGIAVTAQIVVFPWFGIHIPLEDNLTIGLIFTVVSICRSYVLRRAFNWWHVGGFAKLWMKIAFFRARYFGKRYVGYDYGKDDITTRCVCYLHKDKVYVTELTTEGGE